MSSLNDAVSNLVKFIKNYESDIFSASTHKMTKEQAEKILQHLLVKVYDDLDGNDISDIYYSLFNN